MTRLTLFPLFVLTGLFSCGAVFAQDAMVAPPLPEALVAPAMMDVPEDPSVRLMEEMMVEAQVAWEAVAASSQPAAGGVLEQDSLALVALYNATGGENWTNNTNGLSNEPIDAWRGVFVDGNRVVVVQLVNNNLAGALPSELGDLDKLFHLNLSSNGLTGSIPPEVGNLTKLTSLGLQQNQLSGSIPLSLGDLDSLETLFLYGNELSGSIPPKLGELDSLKWLFLYDNQLTGAIPPTLSARPASISLILQHCALLP